MEKKYFIIRSRSGQAGDDTIDKALTWFEMLFHFACAEKFELMIVKGDTTISTKVEDKEMNMEKAKEIFKKLLKFHF